MRLPRQILIWVGVILALFAGPTLAQNHDLSVDIPTINVTLTAEDGTRSRMTLSLSVETGSEVQRKRARERQDALADESAKILVSYPPERMVGELSKGSEGLVWLTDALRPAFVDVLGEDQFVQILYREIIID